MTDTTTTPGTQAAQPPHRASRRRWVAPPPAVLAVAGIVLAVNHWRTSLDVVSGMGPDVKAPANVGDVIFIDTGLNPVPDSGAGSVTVAVNSVEAGWKIEQRRPNSAVVITRTEGLEPWVCVRTGNVGVGVDTEAEARKDCSTLRPLAPSEQLNLDFTATQVLLRLPITQPGTYRIDGALTTYQQGWRTGTVASTIDVTISTP